MEAIFPDPLNYRDFCYTMINDDSLASTNLENKSLMLGGPISKWTNIIKGWQTRYLVLDQAAQMLYYYTSVENYIQGDDRGSIRLRGSVIGIDDDDDFMFTITTDDKSLHFQASSLEERERWIQAIQKVADSHQYLSEAIQICGTGAGNRQIAELDGYLQLLMTHMMNLEVRIKNTSGQERDNAQVVLKSAKQFTESVKYAIFALQMQKAEKSGSSEEKTSQTDVTDRTSAVIDTNVIDFFQSSLPGNWYSSSSEDENISGDEESFFDALDDTQSTDDKIEAQKRNSLTNTPFKYPVEVYDACYDDIEEDETESLVDCSIFTHLLSQVKLGMDLTRVTLPTFILERRSFLEMVADFLAHPDLFISIPDGENPETRFLNVVRWYLSAFHAGRKSVVPKKPYNPILGEIFQCFYKLPSVKKSSVDDGPVPWAESADVSFIAEQVSHHPPVSAYYAECVEKNIEIEGWIWTKSRFLGLSVGVNMVGTTTLKLLNYNEEYTMTFPSAYGRSILSIPWFELGGKVYVECKQTGYKFDCEFLTKPFYGGGKHKLFGVITEPDGRQIYTVNGQWNDKIIIKKDEDTIPFFDVDEYKTISKNVRSIRYQQDNESRRLWRDVTYHLKHGHVDRATDAKRLLEDKQRKETAIRAETGEKWIPKLFKTVSSNSTSEWKYIKNLSSRRAH
ncbi:hypothetical protein GJ496_007699 [Pomphorhynchus laevis]|nr:hypothetical protein GJ496_007699 [Pomphorhynchus laevis]